MNRQPKLIEVKLISHTKRINNLKLNKITFDYFNQLPLDKLVNKEFSEFFIGPETRPKDWGSKPTDEFDYFKRMNTAGNLEIIQKRKGEPNAENKRTKKSICQKILLWKPWMNSIKKKERQNK